MIEKGQRDRERREGRLGRLFVGVIHSKSTLIIARDDLLHAVPVQPHTTQATRRPRPNLSMPALLLDALLQATLCPAKCLPPSSPLHSVIRVRVRVIIIIIRRPTLQTPPSLPPTPTLTPHPGRQHDGALLASSSGSQAGRQGASSCPYFSSS